MSDFLDLVLARSYGATSGAVRPRPVAHFEQPDSIPPDHETPPAGVPPGPALAMAPAVTPSAAPAPPAPRMVTHELSTTRDLLTIRETTIRPAPLSVEPPTAPIEPNQTPSVVVQQITRPSAAPRGDPVAPVEAHVLSAAPARPATPQPVAPLVAPLRPQPQAEPPLAVRPTMPVVHVRIGRVELHGPQPAASPPRPPTPRSVPAPVRPVRSLDDYLRRRNEER